MKNWEPLEIFLASSSSLGDFMFMHCSAVGGETIYSYKHRNTRRYLNLDNQGNCYTHGGVGEYKYRQITPQEALAHVFS
ncbi:MAG: hypothetical protein EG822_13220 [Deltaproteobacteria bacterium]|nr:hypothetical protein [Deltaproteobacteria bacterium]TLN02326.1 MAG: hypothetical protein FDZ73_12395 [bacterium]